MRPIVALAGLLLFASVMYAAEAGAQYGGGTRPISIGVGGGFSVPVGDVRDAFKSGVNLHGFVRLNMPGLPLSFRGGVAYQRFNLDEEKLASGGTSALLAGLAAVQINLISAGPIRPYLTAGLGAYNVRSDPDSAAIASTSSTRFGINGGAGVSLRLGSIMAFAEGRIDNVYTDRGFIDTKTIRVIPVTVGIVF